MWSAGLASSFYTLDIIAIKKKVGTIIVIVWGVLAYCSNIRGIFIVHSIKLDPESMKY